PRADAQQPPAPHPPRAAGGRHPPRAKNRPPPPTATPRPAAQTRRTRAYLDGLPDLDAIRKRVKELNSAPSPDYGALRYRGGTLFAMKRQPPKNQPFLVTLKSPDAPESARAVVDPNAINPNGTTAIDFYVPSLH